MCGQTFAVAKTVPDLSTATRMSWPAANVGLSEFALRSLASHTFTHEFFTGTGAVSLSFMDTALRTPTRDIAVPEKARAEHRSTLNISQAGVAPRLLDAA